MESYPMIPIIGGIVLAAVGATWALHKAGIIAWVAGGVSTWRSRLASGAAGLALAALAWFGVSQGAMPNFRNQFNLEIAKNGCWSFFAAFKQMEIEYKKWYATLPGDESVTRARQLLTTTNETPATALPDDLRRTITAKGEEKRWNVILVCMESYSGDYMSYAGDTLGLSPNLDKLANESVFFDNLYATGTRTVRGMEALTLNLPPTPGQAIIYRPEGTHLVTTFTPFLERGYDCGFFYGGDGRFDYMNRYFSTAGCRIMDVNAWEKSDTTFKTSWGACDEDLFNKTIAEADKNYAAGKPFHYFCMTTSNHRPFEFPEGRLDRANHTRKGAVKYADWAIGNLLENASKKPWYKDTLFVIVADHCSGSAGKTELDVTKFHIPAIIYNPNLVQPKKISGIASQIDVMPTVFGLLNWTHDTLGYGYDRLAVTPAPERAFISNYQKIAMLRQDGLAILKPKATHSLYDYDFAKDVLTPMPAGKGADLLRDTTACYQSASWLFKSGRLKNPNVAKPNTP
jgi:phosphoglycerol transferase MdoB-like AlkP superfamily enzyme